MKKLTICLMTIVALFAAVLPIYGVDFIGSIEQSGVTVPSTSSGVIRDENGQELGQLQLLAGNDDAIDLRDTKNPAVIVTPLSKLAENITRFDKDNSGMTLKEKVKELTRNGVTYHDAASSMLIHKAAETAKNTREFAKKYGEKTVSLLEKAALEHHEKLDDFSPLTIFDVSMNDVARELLKKGNGTAYIPVSVPGITKKSKVIPLHFKGELKDLDQMDLDSLSEEEINQQMKRFDVEVLKYRITEDDELEIEMTDFSPVMILVKDEGETAANAQESEEEPAEEVSAPSTASQTHILLIAGIGLAAFGGALLAGRKAREMN